MKNLFNKAKEIMFRGAVSRLTIAYRTYVIVLFLTIIILLIQNTAYRYSGSKVMLAYYLIVFFVVPIILAIATCIKGASRIKHRGKK